MAQLVSQHWSDISFAVSGGPLPPDYADQLWQAVLVYLPWLMNIPGAGIHALRGAKTEHGLLLSRRSQLQLRLPLSEVDRALALTGKCLDLGESHLLVGDSVSKPVRSFPTLGARCVVMADTVGGEIGFMAAVNEALFSLIGEAQLICGQAVQVRQGGAVLCGHALVIHELSASQSLKLQESGLGQARGLGCGVFVHHKVISGLNDDFDGPD